MLSNQRKRINYISNLDPANFSGGWSGINFNLIKILERYFDVNYCGPINPPVGIFEKIISILKKKVAGLGSFYFFSNGRLNRIAKKVNASIDSQAYADFFFGQTSWIKCNTQRIYFTYIDVAFPDYLENYVGLKGWDLKDIDRINKLEKEFLDGAKCVFFTSEWARENAVKKLGLVNIANQVVVKVAGNIPIPSADVYKYKKGLLKLLFISLKFHEKGGIECYKAFIALKLIYPEAVLNIIGEEPPLNVLKEPGIFYHGKLNKENQEEFRKFEKILSESSFLIHPTKMDATPTVIAEAGYFGCPAIAPNAFGIPDMIIDGSTGVLLHSRDYPQEIAARVNYYFSDENNYLSLREACRDYSIKQLSWEGIGRKIFSEMARY